ncbi:MAG: ABC transporter substrate-binding protein [Bacteroidota bacterium]
MRQLLRVTASILLLLAADGCSRRGKEEGGITVTFWHSFVASTIPALEGLLRDFERDHPAVHINAQYVPTGDGLIQKLVTAIQSRTAPDISWIHTDFLDKLVEADALLPLTPFVNGPEGLSGEEYADIYPPLLEAGTSGGVLYSLPMEATSLALVYNRGLFREHGLDPDRPPRDWDELRQYAAALTADHDGDGRIDHYGFFVPVFPASGELNIWMTLQWTPFLWQAGGVEFSPDGSEARFNSAAGVAALSLWKSIYDLEDFSKFGIAHDLGFASGKLAMVLDGPWNLPRYRAMKDVEWRVAPLPAGPAGRATYLAGEQLVIFRQSAHAAEAWEFIRWMLRPDIQAKFSIASGYLPVRKSVTQLQEYRDHLATDPGLAAFVDEMPMGRSRKQVGHNRVEINRALAGAIEKATLGKSDPKACLDEAAETVNALLR